MSPSLIADQAKLKLDQAVAHFHEELKKLRTGRAHPSMLDGVIVEAYGTQMPINQTATITAPEPQLIQISPFDPNNLQAIASAIRDNQSLGLNPMDDGRVVRVQIPPLNEERRKEITKQVGVKLEDCKIAARNIRHEALKDADQAKQSKQLTEDDLSSIKKQLDELMDKAKAEVDAAAKTKEQEILTV
ncbi:MAG TPA: ribosome recycling factor [Candidatus Saccharimonadales bacterium]|nr:ribosome recycling factor [Candidatus Saccharimonadales bacterium]